MPKKAHKPLFPIASVESLNVAWRTWMDDSLRSNYRLVTALRSVRARPHALQYMLEIERHGKARPDIMRRIITRLATLERNRLYKLLNIKK